MVQIGSIDVDNGALLYVALGGAFMGSYPVPIKAPSVVKANAHPVVFQWYKSFCVLVAGFLMVCFNYLFSSTEFALNWWALASAVTWVPGGLCTIAAVPRLGVAATMVTNSGTASVMSFLVGWLWLGEQMKEHVLDGHKMSFAPLYLLLTIIGMATLAAAPHANTARGHLMDRVHAKGKIYGSTPLGHATGPGRGPASHAAMFGSDMRSLVSGLILAVLAGCFASLQFTAVAFGRQETELADNCHLNSDKTACPSKVAESFNTFGSWTASFGLGAFLAVNVALLMVAYLQDSSSLEFKQIAGPGCLGGCCWVLGALFQTAAVARGGAAVIMPANCTATLITSGLWGLLYYREVKDWVSGFIWVVAALWTMAAASLLFQERVSH